MEGRFYLQAGCSRNPDNADAKAPISPRRGALHDLAAEAQVKTGLDRSA
jgi:hypothetical protein